MPETTPLIKAALNLRGGAGFDVYIFSPAFSTTGIRYSVPFFNITAFLTSFISEIPPFEFSFRQSYRKRIIFTTPSVMKTMRSASLMKQY